MKHRAVAASRVGAAASNDPADRPAPPSETTKPYATALPSLSLVAMYPPTCPKLDRKCREERIYDVIILQEDAAIKSSRNATLGSGPVERARGERPQGAMAREETCSRPSSRRRRPFSSWRAPRLQPS